MDVQRLACAGNAQKLQLICGVGHTWQANGTCSGSTLCDTAMGADQGTCKSVVTECAEKSPGDIVCAGTMRVKCGPDQVTTETVEACPKVCLSGQCTGLCVPGEKQCVGNLPQNCDGTGQWLDETGCAPQTEVCIAGVCGVPPSCSGLASTCGASGKESCCAISVMAGGTYDRGNDATYPATVSSFRLDRFEITVGRFRQFIASYPGNKPTAGAGAHPLIAGSGWQAAWNTNLAGDQTALITEVKCNSKYQTWTDSAGENENKPMNCINWYETFAFCAWDGGRLPTEAEWNYAAAGGNLQRPYPWGATAPGNSYAAYDCTGDGSASGQCASTDIPNVGSMSPMGDGKWGQADLAGGMWEWNLDWYVSPYLAIIGNDYANISQGNATDRVARGGGWGDTASYLLSSFRSYYAPADNEVEVGARCARTP